MHQKIHVRVHERRTLLPEVGTDVGSELDRKEALQFVDKYVVEFRDTFFIIWPRERHSLAETASMACISRLAPDH